MEEGKETLAQEIDRLAGELVSTSRFIHEHPEVGLQEAEAKRALCRLLERGGFDVGPGVATLPTSFVARYQLPPGKPTVVFLAEYDALPGLGHACGHNLIGVAAVGAALGVKAAMTRHRVGGTVLVYGTPAEEGAVDGAGGKVHFVEAGMFRQVDAALMAHPSSHTVVESSGSTGRVALEVTFHGKAAHAAGSPQDGINALDAAILTFNAWNALRQHVSEDVRIHGIISEGGKSPNIIPDLARIRMYVRARDAAYLQEVEERVKDCARGAAQATGARVEFRYTAQTYLSLLPNRTLAAAYKANLERLGARAEQPERKSGGGSTDAGNVSQVVPLIHPYFAICPPGTPGHSPEFAAAAGTPEAYRAMLLAAKVLSMTAYDLLTDPELVARAQAELRDARAGR